MRFKIDTGLMIKIKIDTLKNGGGTFDIYNKQQANTGYMCSIKDIAVIDINDFNFFLIIFRNQLKSVLYLQLADFIWNFSK